MRAILELFWGVATAVWRSGGCRHHLHDGYLSTAVEYHIRDSAEGQEEQNREAILKHCY